MSTLFHICTRCSFLCIVQNALADGEASLGLAFALLFQAGTVQDHGYKRLEGSESYWHSERKEPVNLKHWWLKMSFLTIAAALASRTATSVKSRSFRASFSIFVMPSLKTRIVLLPLHCSCACGNRANT